MGKQDDRIYIVSDFIQGASLKEWNKVKRLGSTKAARLCVQAATALHHAHEAGVVHRDLKPGNVMMDLDGEPHLVELSLEKRDCGEITQPMAAGLIAEQDIRASLYHFSQRLL